MHDPQQLEQWPPTSTCYQTSILLQLVMMLSSPEGTMPCDELSLSLPLSLSLYWSCLCTSNKAVCWGGESSYNRHTNQLKKPLASRFMGLSMLFLKAKVYYHCAIYLVFRQIDFQADLLRCYVAWWATITKSKSKSGPLFTYWIPA